MAKAQTGRSSFPREGHVFIVTYGRSGSTVLQNLLNGLEGVCVRGENNNALLPLAESYEALRSADPLRGMRRNGAVSDPTHPWYGGELIDPAAYGSALAALFLRQVLMPPPGTRMAGFKEIRFHERPARFGLYLDFIAEFFPRSRFVFNTRNPADVARSGWWQQQDPQAVHRIIGRADALYADYAAAHPERSCVLHYDDYVANPEALLPLFELVGRPFDLALVETVMGTRLEHLQGRFPTQKPTAPRAGRAPRTPGSRAGRRKVEA